MKIIINENQRGLLFKNGRYEKLLVPGKHIFLAGNHNVEIMNIDEEFKPYSYHLDIFLKDKILREQLEVVDIADDMIALHYVNGKYSDCLTSGKYAFWKVYNTHEFRLIDIKEPAVSEELPKFIFEVLPKRLFVKLEVAQYQKARLYYDQKFIMLLNEGTYYFWNNGTKINANLVDTRILQMNIAGQEMLTLDKVALRINFVCHYKIIDYIKIFTEIENYVEQIHVTLQLLLREYIGRYRLDEILENREQIADYAFQKLKEKEAGFYVVFHDAGVKDIILPGEIRDIMNTVLIAEKKAQANVIARREEVASTRSLLNTAKLMDENQTLYKLKELEHLEKICENVGTITVSGGTDLLSQLTKILKGS
ncbi:MAG: stomatin family protein [Herbinix sp.]|nr:stomatin family protein [Herbinix sp.]